MNAALVVMTILGCNDSGTDCHYIATASERWPTVAMCDAVSEDHLPTYANQPYPVLISVCQNPQAAGIKEATAQATTVPEIRPQETTTESASAEQATPAPITEQVSPEEAETLAGRAIQRVRNVLPTTEGVKTLMVKPVRLVEDGYSWVARRFER
ncbi:hypothetical protein SAMN03159496_03164 [Rhizobium sp. NFR07]|uniref:hypothetical protein n=1 Tax=Rhizobium sp. NFR07 TaxID=1566262 RepID=UPI0008EC21A2|nr:hypothetical protein [Rhizobium sp. NFR07]SFB36844.1 hypothetical protein SAMN03159496_03164 [Rhizobium sp. NFR07]